VDQQMKKTGLPDFLREKVKDLTGTALEKSIEKAFELLSKGHGLQRQAEGHCGQDSRRRDQSKVSQPGCAIRAALALTHGEFRVTNSSAGPRVTW
jgi:hypothetical protein